VRTVPVGGDLSALLLHPSITPVERIYRRLPNAGVYTATRDRPQKVEAGAFRVPPNQAFCVAEYQFDIFRFNGAAPFDAVPIEARRLPLAFGYDVNIDLSHKGDVAVEILPIPAPTNQEAFQPLPTGGTVTGVGAINPLDIFGQVLAPPAITTVYDSTISTGPNAAALAESTVKASGLGNTLLPQNQASFQGPSRFPFTFYARENQSVQLQIVIFGQVPIPIAFFEIRLAGYLLPINTLDTMLKSMAPCTTQPGSR
jgi:hypothetical protein